MTLGEFKAYVESFPDGKTFNYGISNPFSWRGSYDEVAFEFLEQSMTKEELLEKINLAYTDIFPGYKGGEYYFKNFTPVHFEEDNSTWSDGGYAAEWISNIEGKEPYQTQEERLIKLAFTD